MDAGEAAIAQKVKEAIASDPGIKSKRIYVGVWHSWDRKSLQVLLAGSVAREGERTTAVNDVIRMEGEGWAVDSSLYIEAQSGKAPDALGSWSEPPDSDKPNTSRRAGRNI